MGGILVERTGSVIPGSGNVFKREIINSLHVFYSLGDCPPPCTHSTFCILAEAGRVTAGGLLRCCSIGMAAPKPSVCRVGSTAIIVCFRLEP